MANEEKKGPQKSRRTGQGRQRDDQAQYAKKDYQQVSSLAVADVPCTASLTVVVFQNPDINEKGPLQDGDQFIPGVQVIIDNGERHTLVTDADGEVFLKDLPEGAYSLSVAAPFEHQAAGFFQDGHAIPADNVKVSADRKNVVEVRLRPLLLDIQGCAFIDANGSGDPLGQTPLNGVTVNVSNDQGQIACLRTGKDGCFQGKAPSGGLVAIAAAAQVVADGCTYVRPDAAPILVTPQSCQSSIALAYVPSLAEITVEALLLDDNGNTTKLQGVVFDLYKGTVVASPPLRQAVAEANRPAFFGDLAPGLYTVAANAASYKKKNLELADPAGATKVLALGGGDKGPLVGSNAFFFRMRGARLTVTVRDAENGFGIENVGLVLQAADGSGVPRRASSGPGGTAVFQGVSAGQQIVRLEQARFVSNNTEFVARTAPELSLLVGPSGAAAVEFEVEQDIHAIFGNVSDLNGSAVPHAVVLIQDEDGNVLDQVVADESGAYEWISATAGKFFVSIALDPAGRPAKRHMVTLNSRQRVDLVNLGRAGSPPIGPAKDLSSAVIDIGAYPVLTEEIGSIGSSTAASPFGLPSAPSGRIVQSALRDVLGWRPNAADPKAFVAALTQSFACKDVQGHAECTWVPRTYSVQADLGAVTGAQASIFARAKAALDQSRPLIDGLKPLRSSFDEEDGHAVREIVRFNWAELVNELGREGGPRVQRVDEQFIALLGAAPVANGEKAGGQLGRLRKVFGLRRQNVNTIEEEENLTNFLIVVDLINSLRSSWQEQRPFFSRDDDDVFFGTQTVLLSRSLAVIAESVEEIRFAMNSVFVGPAERQTIELEFNFPGRAKESMLVGDLLEWVHRFASEESPHLIRESGKEGVKSLVSTLNRLGELVRASLIDPDKKGQQGSTNLPSGYRTARVQRAVEELAGHLEEAHELADEIKESEDED
jgi:hypothetical protein